MLKLFGREARALPRALAREHWQSVSEKEAGMAKSIQTMAGMEAANPGSGETPARSWGEIFMAILPFLLILLVDTLPMLMVESGLLTWESTAMKVVNITLLILMFGALLVTFFLAWRRKWPLWSATWYVFFVAALLTLSIGMLALLFQERLMDALSQTLVGYIGLPLIPAVLLYTATRRNPLRGLLAALPLLYLLWTFENMEFVPASIEVGIKIPSVALLCLTVAFLLRQGIWRTGLYAVLGVNLVVGILFSYAGIYHGGTLPSSAIGPNSIEVARNLIPQYLVIGAILVGPLFAWKIRQAGRSAGRAGRVSYHLALAGLLLVILANLASLILGTEPSSGRLASSSRSALVTAIVLGLGVYLLSLSFNLFYLFRDIPHSRTVPGWASPGWPVRILLVLLPLAIPLTFMLPFITWKWPVHDLYGTPLLWELPHTQSLSIGVVWLALSVWVVTQGAEAARPTAAVGEASEAPLLR